jgi:hypothetical protein
MWFKRVRVYIVVYNTKIKGNQPAGSFEYSVEGYELEKERKIHEEHWLDINESKSKASTS